MSEAKGPYKPKMEAGYWAVGGPTYVVGIFASEKEAQAAANTLNSAHAAGVEEGMKRMGGIATRILSDLHDESEDCVFNGGEGCLTCFGQGEIADAIDELKSPPGA